MEPELDRLVKDYRIASEAVEIVRQTPVVILVGVSGAGKDTIRRRLLETGKYHNLVTYTTRQPRVNGGVLEKDGEAYHFITKEQAIDMLNRGEFIEVNIYSGNIYGSSVTEVQKAYNTGKIALTDIDVHGVAAYKSIAPTVIAEFILPPNYAEWQRRLKSRYGQTGADPSDLAKRMHAAIAELEEALDKPYYHFVVNEDLDEAVHAADSIGRHHDEFTQIDRSYRVWAERLLEDLRKGM